jgi:hypothetical protein
LVLMLGGITSAQINLGPTGTIQVKGTLGPTKGGTGKNTWTKGDLLCGTGSNTTGQLAVGTNTDILVADSTQTCGFKWAVPSVTDAQVVFSDITTGNASTSNHGFLKKLDGNAAHFLDGTGAWATPAGAGTVTHTGGALTLNELVCGAGSADISVCDLTGDVTTSGSKATTIATKYKTHICEIVVGDPAGSVLADGNDTPVVCGNITGADVTITAAACYADAGSPTVTPILTGGSGTSVLTGALTCGTASWAAGTINGTPTIHSFSANGATCSSTPCTLDANITTAGGTAKYIVMHFTIAQ